MPRYSATHTKAAVNTANTIMWQLRAIATSRIWMYELGLSIATAPTTGPNFRLVRSTAVGTSSATVTPQPEDPDTAAATALLDTTWSVNPTLAGTDLRNYAVPNTIGSGIVWTWYDQPFVIPKSTGVSIVNGNAAGATLGSLTIYAVYSE